MNLSIKIRFVLLCVGCALLSSGGSFAQQTSPQKSKNWIIRTSYFQVKDQHNFGLVFDGATINFGYRSKREYKQSTLVYEGWLGVGPGFSKGMTMIHSQFKPVDLFYGFDIANSETSKLILGPYFSANYHYQFYPETHGGTTLWFTQLDFGIKLLTQKQVGANVIEFQLANSLFGFASRPPEELDPYYYSLKFTDFISNAHSNMKFGSFDLMNHTQLTLAYIITGGKRKKSFGYQFNYMSYKPEPNYKYSEHTLFYNFWIKNKKQ